MDREQRRTLLEDLNKLGPVLEEKEIGADEYSDGRLARAYDHPFEENKSRPWKLGWLDAAEDHDELLEKD
jgi:hypothetical protein